MILDELLDLLERLPTSARSARVEVTDGNFDSDILSVEYVQGTVRIGCEPMDREDTEEAEEESPDDEN